LNFLSKINYLRWFDNEKSVLTFQGPLWADTKRRCMCGNPELQHNQIS
jgi:hypothetical protein